MGKIAKKLIAIGLSCALLCSFMPNLAFAEVESAEQTVTPPAQSTHDVLASTILAPLADPQWIDIETGTTYETFTEACINVPDGNELIALQDIDEPLIVPQEATGKNLTIRGGWHTFSGGLLVDFPLESLHIETMAFEGVGAIFSAPIDDLTFNYCTFVDISLEGDESAAITTLGVGTALTLREVTIENVVLSGQTGNPSGLYGANLSSLDVQGCTFTGDISGTAIKVVDLGDIVSIFNNQILAWGDGTDPANAHAIDIQVAAGVTPLLVLQRNKMNNADFDPATYGALVKVSGGAYSGQSAALNYAYWNGFDPSEDTVAGGVGILDVAGAPGLVPEVFPYYLDAEMTMLVYQGQDPIFEADDLRRMIDELDGTSDPLQVVPVMQAVIYASKPVLSSMTTPEDAARFVKLEDLVMPIVSGSFLPTVANNLANPPVSGFEITGLLLTAMRVADRSGGPYTPLSNLYHSGQTGGIPDTIDPDTVKFFDITRSVDSEHTVIMGVQPVVPLTVTLTIDDPEGVYADTSRVRAVVYGVGGTEDYSTLSPIAVTHDGSQLVVSFTFTEVYSGFSAPSFALAMLTQEDPGPSPEPTPTPVPTPPSGSTSSNASTGDTPNGIVVFALLAFSALGTAVWTTRTFRRKTR